MALFKMPKFRNPVKTRPDGSKEVGGLTAKEWGVTMFALISLWIVMGLVFTGLLSVATAVRDRGSVFNRPGREECLYGEPGCDKVNPLDK